MNADNDSEAGCKESFFSKVHLSHSGIDIVLFHIFQ